MAQTSRSADLTSGPMLQKIILFSIPLAASSILQLLFNAADVVVVGRFAGSTALAAVGSNGSLINLLVNLFVGLSLGANVVAARCFGAKDDRGVQDTVQTSVTLGLVSGVLLAVVGFFAARGLLELMSCPEAAYERKMYRYKAQYSLDCENGIENAVLLKPKTPEMLLEEKQLQEQIYSAVMNLPEKQAKRIYARYYLGMTVNEIAGIGSEIFFGINIDHFAA